MTRLREHLTQRRELIGKFIFEIVIIFVGVTAAFALENVRQQGEEVAYRARMIAALGPTLDDVVSHGAEIDREMGGSLMAFDAASARGERPALPVYREKGGERPPTRIWDGVMATGAAKSLDPALFFRVAHFYNVLDSFGERYVRYSDFTETHVLGLGDDPGAAYEAGRLKPEFRAYVARLRELQGANRDLMREAVAIRHDLARKG